MEPDPIASAIAEQDEDHIMLFEDDSVSIWTSRFHPTEVIPPHEHKMDVHIAVFRGGEKNILYRRENGVAKHVSSKVVKSGEIFSMGANGIHAVTADGSEPSLAIHVYLGPLMQVERFLFDWDTGEEVEYTMENFENMTRPVSAFSDL